MWQPKGSQSDPYQAQMKCRQSAFLLCLIFRCGEGVGVPEGHSWRIFGRRANLSVLSLLRGIKDPGQNYLRAQKHDIFHFWPLPIFALCSYKLGVPPEHRQVYVGVWMQNQ